MRTGDRMPESLRNALTTLFGDDVDDVEIAERSWYARLHLGARATTRRNRILLPGTAEEFFADPELVLHEYFHVLRQWNRGRLSIAAYLAEWLRRGYWRNRYEHQARRFVRLRLGAFQALLPGPPGTGVPGLSNGAIEATAAGIAAGNMNGVGATADHATGLPDERFEAPVTVARNP